LAQRYTRLSAPQGKDPWLVRVWRAVTELQKDVTVAQEDITALDEAQVGAWAVVTASLDQATIDESVPDLVTAWNTISYGSSGHGVTVSAGVITLPVNTPGYQWELDARVYATHSALGQVGFRFYQLPATTNTAIGLVGLQNSATYTSHGSQGGAGDAMAWVSGPTTVGLRCTIATGANTVTVEQEWSRVICREVRA
jgi:hypothetical protein